MISNTNQKLNKINSESIVVDIIGSALKNDIDRVQKLALLLSRLLRDSEPSISKKIADSLGAFSLGLNPLRSDSNNPVPVDTDTQLEMATIITPNLTEYEEPILNEGVINKVNEFLEEREKLNKLLERNIKPSTSLLLIGPPGTGKTMLAHYIASYLNKNLIVLDLAASISSLLGKTGYNLKRVLKYARQTSSVLLLDEFDAIAKRRDDPTDLGELKRVVNVLLMELESWPVSSVLIATSNHPELLDKAIWRRFDHVITLDMPNVGEIKKILDKEIGTLLPKSDKRIFLEISPQLLLGRSPSDICKFCSNVLRKIVLKDISPRLAFIDELSDFMEDKNIKGKFCITAKKILGKSITVRKLSELTGLSPAGVQYHLKGNK